MHDALEREVEDLTVEGWKLHEQHGDDRVTMLKPDYGSFGPHALVALLTAWWTLGLGNVAYAAKRYWMNSTKKVVRAEDVADTTADTDTDADGGGGA